MSTAGAAIDAREHLYQRIADILNTPIGSRVMRREYGSMIPDLVDRPLNGATILDIIYGASVAIARWEPYARVARVNVQGDSAIGQAVIDVELRLRDGSVVALEGLVIGAVVASRRVALPDEPPDPGVPPRRVRVTSSGAIRITSTGARRTLN